VQVAAVPESEFAGALFEQYQPGLYRFCLRRLRSPEDAEDAVQATFVRAVRALQHGVRPEVAPAWLFTIARNVCSSRRLAGLRRGRVETPRDLDRVPAAALAREDERPDELLGLGDALAQMTPQLRRVLLLREWQGLSYREIAAELGVSQSAVESLAFRARRDLAKRLEQPWSRLRRLLDFGPLLGLKALLGGATVAAVAIATVHAPRPVARADGVQARVAVAAPVPHAATLPVVAVHVTAVRLPHRVHAAVQTAVRIAVVARPAPRRHVPTHVVVAPRKETVPVPRASPGAPAIVAAAPEPQSAPEPAPAPEPSQQQAPAPPPQQAPAGPARTAPAPVVGGPAAGSPAVTAPDPVPQAVDTVEQTSADLTSSVATVLPSPPSVDVPAFATVTTPLP